MRKIIAALAAAALSIAGLTASTTPAQAHTVSSYFGTGLWPDNQSVSYGLDSGFPTGAHRERVLNGAQAWRSFSSTNTPDIYWTEADDVEWGTHRTFGSGCTLRGKINVGGVFWMNLSGTTLGQTQMCGIGTTFKAFTLAFDSDTAWYTGTGIPPGGQYDMASTAAHEFGHAMGWTTHFTSGSAECPTGSSASLHTMCTDAPVGNYSRRDTESHDEHTYDSAY